jgi:hypothetical protein
VTWNLDLGACCMIWRNEGIISDHKSSSRPHRRSDSEHGANRENKMLPWDSRRFILCSTSHLPGAYLVD